MRVSPQQVVYHHILSMKKSLLLSILCLFFTPALTKAQQNWEEAASPAGQSSALAVNPENGHIFITTYEEGIFRSDDGGDTWHQIYFTAADPTFYSIAIRHDGVLFAGGIGAMFRSTDNGRTWVKHTLDNNLAFTQIAFTPEGHILVGTQTLINGFIASSRTGGGLFRSQDNGLSWTLLNAGLENTNKCIGAIHVGPQGQIFIGLHDQGATNNGGVFRLQPASETWQNVAIKLTSNDQSVRTLTVRYVYGLIFDGTTLYVSLEAVSSRLIYRLMMKSTDVGETWQIAPVVLPQPDPVNEQPLFWSMYQCDNFIVGHISNVGSGGGVYFSNENGGWTQYPNIQASNALRFAKAPNGRLYAVELVSSRFFRLSTITGNPDDILPGRPVRLSPNPSSSGSITISFELPVAADAQIGVYNMLGQPIQQLVRNKLQAGNHSFVWEASGQPAGTYLVRFTIADKVQVHRVVLYN